MAGLVVRLRSWGCFGGRSDAGLAGFASDRRICGSLNERKLRQNLRRTAATKSGRCNDRPYHQRGWSGHHSCTSGATQLTLRRTKTQDKRMRLVTKGPYAAAGTSPRQRWPFGQHKIAVCRVAPTAVPRIPRVNLPMAAPFVSARDEVSAFTIAVAAQYISARRERPLVHIRTRICAGDPVPLKPATLLPSSPTNCRKLILKLLDPQAASQSA